MGSSRSNRGLAVLMAMGILLALVPLQENIHRSRPDLFDPDRRTRKVSLIDVGPTPAVIAAMGGFRTLAADLLWLKAEHVWHGGNWWALLPIMDTITKLDPHFLMAWRVYGWHCAYNLAIESTTIVDRRYWLQKGLDVLEQGVQANPKSWEIYFELGWTYYDRAREHYRAHEYLMQADQQKGAPDYVTRMTYRPFEHMLDFDRLFPALEYAKSRHPDSEHHQKIVARDLAWWQERWNDPREHRRQIVRENTARRERGVPYHLYPGNPYWDVCRICGLPSPKGSEVCEVCGHELPKTEPSEPVSAGDRE